MENEYGVNIKIGLPVSTENVPNEKTLNIIKNVGQNKSVEKSFDNAEELIKNLNS
jgi:antitoxin component of RelBE/YafQ-DinJ toxin-antitoxin module